MEKKNIELETLHSNKHRIHFLIGFVCVVVLLVVFIVGRSHARYRVTESIPLVNGTINYSLADLNIVAITVDGESVDTIPEGNYELTENSYCTVNGEEDSSISISYEADTQLFTVTPFTTKGTKCYLDFKTATTRPVETTLLGTINVNLDTPDFSKTSCTSKTYNGTARTCGEETVGIYEETTSKGTTYYWRGDVENNYLVFANKYWRIIRINEDGTLRIIYSGEKSEVDAAGKEKVLANGYNDGSTDYTQTQTSAYNTSNNASYYVGYTYQTNVQRPSNQNGGTASTIKGILDTWYSNNLSSYDSKIASGGSAGFCNDREMRTGYSWSATPSSTIYYKAYERLITNKTPSFECSNTLDLYTTKIGLITADEVMYAGGAISSNYGYYLYTGNYYWTMSPSYFNATSSYARVFLVRSYGSFDSIGVNNTWGVRPVINIASNVTITGSGTISDPYVVL